MNELNLSSQFNINGCTALPESGVVQTANQYYNFYITRVTGGGYYTSSLLGSGNYVGYGKVTRQHVDQQGNSNGSHISYYSNVADIGAYDVTRKMSLPSRKIMGPLIMDL